MSLPDLLAKVFSAKSVLTVLHLVTALAVPFPYQWKYAIQAATFICALLGSVVSFHLPKNAKLLHRRWQAIIGGVIAALLLLLYNQLIMNLAPTPAQTVYYDVGGFLLACVMFAAYGFCAAEVAKAFVREEQASEGNNGKSKVAKPRKRKGNIATGNESEQITEETVEPNPQLETPIIAKKRISLEKREPKTEPRS